MMKVLLYIALIVSLLTYSFWHYLPQGAFYIGNAFFISIICLYMHMTDKYSDIKFVLFALSINNLIDETFLNPNEYNVSEILVGLFIILLTYLRNVRKRTINNK